MAVISSAAFPDIHVKSDSADEKAKLIDARKTEITSTDSKEKPIASLADISKKNATTSAIAVENQDKSISAALSKSNSKLAFYKRMMNGFISLLYAFIIAVLMTAILVATVKALVITYCVQSAVEISVFANKIVLNVQKYFSSRKAIDHSKELSIKTESNTLDIHKTRNLEAQQNIVKQSTKAGISFVILALTVVSFLPIPIVAQAAQAGLALIALGFFVYWCIERYQKYKEQQAKAELAAENPDSKEPEPPNKDHTLTPSVEESKSPELITENQEAKQPLLVTSLKEEKRDDTIEAVTIEIPEKPMEFCAMDDNNLSITATPVIDSVVEKNTLSNTAAPQPAEVNSNELVNTNDIQINESAPESPNHKNEFSSHSVLNNNVYYEEIYMGKCNESKFRTQQYEEVLRTVKMQKRDAELRACRPVETSISTIRTSAASAA